MLATDRRRVVIASLLTGVALPALWFFNNNSTPKSTGADGTPVTAPPTTKYVPETPLFVGGNDAPKAPSVINIVVPSAPSANSVKGVASFHRYPATLPRACTVPKAPDAALVTVINIDNGQTTTCTNTLTLTTPDGVDVLLDTGVFTEIGNVADAPIPVRASW